MIALLWFLLALQVAPTAHYRHHGRAVLPDSLVTPGAIVSADTSIICRKGYATKARALDTALFRKLRGPIYRAYGVKAGHIQLDHLIPVEIGGATSVKNLWPQPTRGVTAAHAKDVLENRVHKAVCSGKLALPDAQARIAADWVALSHRLP